MRRFAPDAGVAAAGDGQRSFSNPIVTIPGFQFEEECRNTAEYDALQQKSGDTRVRDAFCLIQRGCRPNGQHEPMQD